MSELQRQIHPWAPQRDRNRPIVEGDDRLDETAHMRRQLVSDAVTHPTLAHVGRCDRGAVGETGILAQGDDPRPPVCIEPPGFCQPWADASLAVESNQRLVELTEQQLLALVRRAGCIRGIDSVGEGNGRDGLARLGDQCAIERPRLGTWSGRHRRWRRFRGRSTGARSLRRLRRWWGNRYFRRRARRAARTCHSRQTDDEPDGCERSTRYLHGFAHDSRDSLMDPNLRSAVSKRSAGFCRRGLRWPADAKCSMSRTSVRTMGSDRTAGSSSVTHALPRSGEAFGCPAVPRSTRREFCERPIPPAIRARTASRSSAASCRLASRRSRVLNDC